MKKILLVILMFACMISPALAQTCVGGRCTVTIGSVSSYKAMPASSDMVWDSDVKSFHFSYIKYNFKVEPFLIIGGELVPIESFKDYFPDMSIVGHSSDEGDSFKFYTVLSNIPAEFYDMVDNFGYRIVLPADESLKQSDMVSLGDAVLLKDDFRIGYGDLIESGYTIDIIEKDYVYIGFNKFIGSKELSFDPTIQLQTADTQNLGDTYVNAGAINTNYGTSYLAEQGNVGGQKNTLVMFNTTSVPAGQGIDDAEFCMYLFANPLTGGNAILVDAHHLFQNYTCGGVQWNESCPTWNLRPNSSYYNTTSMGSINFTSASPTGTWYCWDVTNAVSMSYSQGYQNTSFYMIASVGSGSPTSDINFRSKEYATASLRPYLNITYHDVSAPQWSSNSTNSTGVSGQPILHSTYWTDNNNLSNFIFSTNITGSWVNDTAQLFVNGWANVTKTAPSDGVVGWQVFANDTGDNWNSTPVFEYVIHNLNLTSVYPAEVNETGNYSVLAYYLYNGTLVPNATLTLCYTFTSTQCFNMTESADYYYWNFSYDHDIGGIVQFNITAYYDLYPDLADVFYITFFDAKYYVRFWQDLNKTQPYFNEFLWVYAKPHCNIFDQLLYFGLYDTCVKTAYHAKYTGGVANLSIWSPNAYDFYVVDGTVSWNCSTCEPSVVGYEVWSMFDTITITASGESSNDYFWNTTVYGRYPLFGSFEWDFLLSVIGIIILIAVSCLVAFYSDNGLASVFVIILVYILLKLFHILTGAIFWIF